MADQIRSCRRTACRWLAAASLSFRYATKEVWLLDLSEEPDPSLYDLCPQHADALTVPVGWERVDQRKNPSAVTDPMSRQSSGREMSGRDLLEVRQSSASNRYAALSRDLPRLAAAWASVARHAEDGDRRRPPPSRDLAPTDLELAGQLAIPVEELARDDDAVVVSIEMAGRRRAAE